MFDRLFFHHPRAIGESYGAHFMTAFGFGFSMVLAGLACLVHALVPGFFISTGSQTIERLHQAMVINRRNKPRQGVGAAITTIRD